MNQNNTKILYRDNRIKDTSKEEPTNDLPSLPVIPILLNGGVKVKYIPKCNAELCKMNQSELYMEYIKLREAHERIEKLSEHIRVEVGYGYGAEYDIKEYGIEGQSPYEVMDNVIKDLEDGLKSAKMLRGHSHEWLDMHGDGRDLSCVCTICGCQET